ncbi:cyclophilin-like fold protein [Nostoc sp. LEGE 06077]|uniref:cyclophilin-like fold protein n=1 Tax=Nostoc sp. LEGE 06077 TaxID=915325 RepID=UPI001D148CEE|nr:cyclophilin-like fold protein [Nostoc sp. LEGE 06077]
MLILVLALAMSLSSSACRADNSITSNAPSEIPTELSTEQANRMKINIRVGNEVVTATLIDSKTTQDFISLLPLTLTLEDHANTEKVSDLPRRLSTEDAPSGSDPAVGDIAYYAPWGNLAMYYNDFGYSNGLIILGKIDGDIEALNVPGSVEVTIELQAQ